MLKTCSKCKQSLLIDCFSKRVSHKDGLQHKCKNCINQMNRDYRSDNKLQVNQTARNWRFANRVKTSAYNKKQRGLNPQKEIERHLKYRTENVEKIRVASDKYRRENLDKARQRSNARRAKKVSNGVFKVSNKEMKILYNSLCFYCKSSNQIEVDHVIPISRGGTHSIGNLVPACRDCNRTKGSKFLIEWKIQLKEKRIENVK